MNRRSDIEEGFATSQPTGALAGTTLPCGKRSLPQAITVAGEQAKTPDKSGADLSIPPAQRQLTGRLGRLTLSKQVLVIAIWPFLEQVLNFFVGFIDTLLAGHLSVEATNAIGVASYIGWLIGILQMAVGTGAAAVISRAIGGGHKRVANAALGQAIILAIAMGILSGSLIYLLTPSICKVVHLTGQSYELGVTYLRIISLGAPACSILFVGTACLRASGDTRSPFWVLAALNVVNISVSALLTYGRAPFGGHGVAGIAIGTAVAWCFGAVLCLVVLIKPKLGGGIRLRLLRMRPHWHTMKRIVRVASASLVESLGMWVGNFMLIMLVGSLSATLPAALGAHMIAVRLEAISYMPCFALGIAASTLTGQYLGLGDPARAKRAAVMCWAYGMVVMGAMGFIFWWLAVPLVRLVTDKPELIEIAPDLLRICAPIQLFFATAIVLSSAMRGAGATRSTMIVTYIGTWLIRLPAAYLICEYLDWGLNGIWVAMCGELAIRGCLFGYRFFKGDWAKVEV